MLELVEYGKVTNSNCVYVPKLYQPSNDRMGRTSYRVDQLEKCKLVMEGSSTEVAIKYRQPQRLHRCLLQRITSCTVSVPVIRMLSITVFFSSLLSMCCIDAPTVSQGVQNLLSATAGIARATETSRNVLHVNQCARVMHKAGHVIDAVQTVTRTVTSSMAQTTQFIQSDVVNNPLLHLMTQTLSWSTTTDESTASATGVQTSSTQHDLQSAVAADCISPASHGSSDASGDGAHLRH